jgi:hypothetical protein
MVNFHIPGTLGQEQATFAIVIGWEEAIDSVSVVNSNNGVPEPYVIFFLKAWLKNYETTNEQDFHAAFFADSSEK